MHGIYVRKQPEHTEQHPDYRARAKHCAIALALASELKAGDYFGYETAAAIWGLPVRVNAATAIQVVSLDSDRRIQRRGVKHWHSTPALIDPVQFKGVHLASPSATWCMLAPRLSQRDAVAMGDAVLRHTRIPGTQRFESPPLATHTDLQAAINTPYRRSRTQLLQLATVLTSRSASVPETHLRLLLTDNGFAPEALDLDVWDAEGRLVGCSEIAYPSRKIVAEYEGNHHRTETRQWNRDIEKYAAYTALGWIVVRVTADMLYRRQDELLQYMTRVFHGRPAHVTDAW